MTELGLVKEKLLEREQSMVEVSLMAVLWMVVCRTAKNQSYLEGQLMRSMERKNLIVDILCRLLPIFSLFLIILYFFFQVTSH